MSLRGELPEIDNITTFPRNTSRSWRGIIAGFTDWVKLSSHRWRGIFFFSALLHPSGPQETGRVWTLV